MLTFTKGHGTENDFVVVPDPDGELTLSADQVARLCDRRAGIGGDGLIRVVRTAALGEWTPGDPVGEDVVDTEWFMDYRNADGSISEMCGNGVRVFVQYLAEHGLVEEAQLTDPNGLAICTRAGVKRVHRRPDGWLAVDMGPWRIVHGEQAAARGSDTDVSWFGGPDDLPGLSVDLGNPHVVTVLTQEAELSALDLSRAPVLDPVPVDGANVEAVVVHDPDGDLGRLSMRVFERGVGETRSCGTGACAAVLAARVWGGVSSPKHWRVDVPGGQVDVRLLPSGNVELAGPARLVATGTTTL